MALFATHASAVGVIGGADGPTVIYTTDSTPFILWIAIAICVAAIALLAFLALRRRK